MSKSTDGMPAMRSLKLFDTFSEPSYLTASNGAAPGANATGGSKGATSGSTTKEKTKGSTYINPKPFIPSSGPKMGHTDKELLQKGYVPLGATTPYFNMDQYERQQHLADMKRRNLQPFRPSNPGKKSVGLGGIYGTFTPPLKHEADTEPKKLTKDDIKHEPRNFLVNPGKKGGYGYYHTTIGGKEYPYTVGDPSKAQTKERAFPGRNTSSSTPNRPAFCSTSHGNRLFTGNAIYANTVDPSVAKRSASEPRRAGSARERGGAGGTGNGKLEGRPAFCGMSVTKGTLSPFPEYKIVKEDPVNPRSLVKHEKVWMPSGTNTLSTPSASIATMGLSASRIFARSRGR